MKVNEVLKNRRIELELTMKEVADMVGVSEGTVSRWESGDIANMKRDKINALAHALKIHPGVIMGWSGYEGGAQSGFSLSPSEKELVLAFRKAPSGIQSSVRILLGIEQRLESAASE